MLDQHGRGDPAYEMGAFAARLTALENDVRETREDVKSMLETINQSKGTWKFVLMIAGLSGTAGALFDRMTHLFK